MMERPQYLVQQNQRISIKEAEKIVDGILSILNIKQNFANKQQQLIPFNVGTSIQKIKYYQLVIKVRQTGILDIFQNNIDRSDSVFGGTLGMATTAGLKITTSWAGYLKELTGPCISRPSELELVDDIEFYKQETCIESNNTDFTLCVRNYRGYLYSCIALMDTYINRHIIYFHHIGYKKTAIAKLKEIKNTEERIEFFVHSFCNFSIEQLKSDICWDHFKQLKNLRNEIIHSIEPYFGVELRQIARNLNLSIQGVGYFLKKLQEGQGRHSLGFIERIRNSHVVDFNNFKKNPDGIFLDHIEFQKIIR